MKITYLLTYSITVLRIVVLIDCFVLVFVTVALLFSRRVFYTVDVKTFKRIFKRFRNVIKCEKNKKRVCKR